MTPRLAASCLMLAAASLAAPGARAAETAAKTAFADEDAKVMYSYGFQVGRNVAGLGFSEAELTQVLAGLKDGALEKSPALDTSAFEPQMKDMLQKHAEAKLKKTKAAGESYAKKFSKDAGVKAIPNGGWIKTLEKGSGKAPKAEDTVKVNYRGTFINELEFDSSYKRKEPTTFPLNRVIPCWTNGVAQMKVGGKARLVCPSDVAYGDQGRPGIPGGATLVFEIELLDIVKPEAPAAGKE